MSPKYSEFWKPRHVISSFGCDGLHHTEFLDVASDKIQERQLVKVACLLISRFHDRVIALFQRSCTQTFPNILSVDGPSHFERHGEVATFDCEIEAGLLVLHKVESDLGVSFLLEIADDALTDKVR